MISPIKPYTNKPIINNNLRPRQEITFKQAEQVKPKNTNSPNSEFEKKLNNFIEYAKSIIITAGFLATLGFIWLLDGLRCAPKKLLKQ